AGGADRARAARAHAPAGARRVTVRGPTGRGGGGGRPGPRDHGRRPAPSRARRRRRQIRQGLVGGVTESSAESPGRKFLLVGLTGGIATGKSTVSAIFTSLGCVLIDADVLAREVVEPGEPAHRAIVEEFGTGVLQADGALDRKKLGAVVFADPARRKRL